MYNILDLKRTGIQTGIVVWSWTMATILISLSEAKSDSPILYSNSNQLPQQTVNELPDFWVSTNSVTYPWENQDQDTQPSIEHQDTINSNGTLQNKPSGADINFENFKSFLMFLHGIRQLEKSVVYQSPIVDDDASGDNDLPFYPNLNSFDRPLIDHAAVHSFRGKRSVTKDNYSGDNLFSFQEESDGDFLKHALPGKTNGRTKRQVTDNVPSEPEDKANDEQRLRRDATSLLLSNKLKQNPIGIYWNNRGRRSDSNVDLKDFPLPKGSYWHHRGKKPNMDGEMTPPVETLFVKRGNTPKRDGNLLLKDDSVKPFWVPRGRRSGEKTALWTSKRDFGVGQTRDGVLIPVNIAEKENPFWFHNGRKDIFNNKQFVPSQEGRQDPHLIIIPKGNDGEGKKSFWTSKGKKSTWNNALIDGIFGKSKRTFSTNPEKNDEDFWMKRSRQEIYQTNPSFWNSRDERNYSSSQ